MKPKPVDSFKSDKSWVDPSNSLMETVQLKEVHDLVERDKLQFPSDRLNDDVLQYSKARDKKEKKLDAMVHKPKKD